MRKILIMQLNIWKEKVNVVTCEKIRNNDTNDIMHVDLNLIWTFC